MAEGVADPDRPFQHGVAAELAQVVDVMNVERGTDEDVVGEIDLYSDAAVNLKWFAPSKY